MSKIAFLGLGAMGSRMVAHLVTAGHDITVWNRSRPEQQPSNTRWATSPAAAATDADIVIAMIRDDDASATIWLGDTGALATMKPGALAIECSTLSRPWILDLSATMARHNINFAEAPLAGSRPQAEAAELVFFTGCDKAIHEQAASVLEHMGKAIIHAGPIGTAAAVKLTINAMFALQLAGYAELRQFAEKSGIAPEKLTTILSKTPVCSPIMGISAAAMDQQQFAPMFPIDLVEKDLGLAVRSASDAGTGLPLTVALRAQYDAAKQAGFGDDNINGIARLYAA